MSEEAVSQRIAVVWSPEARTSRAMTARLLCKFSHCVDRYLLNRTGDVKRLKPPFTGYPLRCGDYRIFFDLEDENTIAVTEVLNRREAYR